MARPRRPDWVTAVGIVAIIFSGFGLLIAMQLILTPVLQEAQQAQIQSTIDEYNKVMAELPEKAKHASGFMHSTIEMLKKTLNQPAWYINWLMIAGILSLLIHSFYLTSAIWFFKLKPNSPGYLGLALSFSIILGVIRIVVSYPVFENLTFMVMGSTFAAVVVEAVLLFFIRRKDKSAFYQLAA